MYHYREDPHIGYFRGVPPILLHPSFYHTLCNMLLLAKRAHWLFKEGGWFLVAVSFSDPHNHYLYNSKHYLYGIWFRCRWGLVHPNVIKHQPWNLKQQVTALKPAFSVGVQSPPINITAARKYILSGYHLKIHTENNPNPWAKLFPNIHSSRRHVRLKVQQFHQAAGLKSKPTCVMLRFQGNEPTLSLVRMLNKNKNAGIKYCMWPFLNFIFWSEFVVGAKLTTMESE